MRYDYLVVAAGCKTNTFGVRGIAEREGREVFFLKHLHHARQIRNRVLECFERAASPVVSDAERRRLLSFVIVGGGATSCEFTTELADFLDRDVARWYPDLAPLVKVRPARERLRIPLFLGRVVCGCDPVLVAQVSLVEAGPRILGSFDAALVDYYADHLRRRVHVARPRTAWTQHTLQLRTLCA